MVLRDGGKDDQSTLFEHWDIAKLDKYNIDLDDYDHTDIAEKPIILIDNYHNRKNPYLAMIYL